MPSVVASAYFTQPNPALAASQPTTAECRSKLVADPKNAVSDKRNDVVGIFATSCRHGCIEEVGRNMSMPTRAMEALRRKYPKAGIILFYDLACRSGPHLQVNHPEVAPWLAVIPALHAYCHSRTCQVNFSPRTRYTLGQTDGEGSERFWSRLGPFIGHTQVMTHANRHFHLVHKFEAINRQVTKSLPAYFSMQLVAIAAEHDGSCRNATPRTKRSAGNCSTAVLFTGRWTSWTRPRAT